MSTWVLVNKVHAKTFTAYKPVCMECGKEIKGMVYIVYDNYTHQELEMGPDCARHFIEGRKN